MLHSFIIIALITYDGKEIENDRLQRMEVILYKRINFCKDRNNRTTLNDVCTWMSRTHTTMAQVHLYLSWYASILSRNDRNASIKWKKITFYKIVLCCSFFAARLLRSRDLSVRVLSSYSLKSFMKQFVHSTSASSGYTTQYIKQHNCNTATTWKCVRFFLAHVILNGNAVFLMCILLMMIFAVRLEPCRR